MLSAIGALGLLVTFMISLHLTGSRRQISTAFPLSFLGDPTLSARGVVFSVSNHSSAPVLFFACPPQKKSNGVWDDVQIPRPVKLTRLRARHVATVVVVAQKLEGDRRVPLLWGFEPAKSRELVDSAMRCLSGRRMDLQLSIFTNFSPQITQ